MPVIGETAMAEDIGLPTYGRHRMVWHACLTCSLERWVVLRKGEPTSLRCPKCGPANANRARTRKVGDDGLLECSVCNERKALADFTPRSDTAARVGACRACQTERVRRWRAANRERHRENTRAYERRRPEVGWASAIKSRYGVTAEQFQAMESAQGGVCAICRAPPQRGRLNIDHCHGTGRVRGLLCGPCNRMLGLAKDRPEVLAAAVAYLNPDAAEQMIEHLSTKETKP